MTDSGKDSKNTDQRLDDDFLELTEAVNPDVEDEDETIELSDPTEDGIIELFEPEEELASEENDVLELDDFADDEILDLFEIAEDAGSEDEDVIALEELAEEETASPDDLVADEAVLDLSEIAEDAGSDDEDVIALEELAEEEIALPDDLADDEAVFDLSEVAEDAGSADEDIMALEEPSDEDIDDLSNTAVKMAPEDEEGMDFLDIAESLPLETRPNENETASDMINELDDISEDVRMIGDSLQQELESDPFEAECPEPQTLPLNVSPEQLEQALERVVKSMFEEKIESILFEVIEKRVAREVQKIKDLLTEHSAD